MPSLSKVLNDNSDISKSVSVLHLLTFVVIFSCGNFDKQSIKNKFYPKSTKVDVFIQKSVPRPYVDSIIDYGIDYIDYVFFCWFLR